MPEDWVDFSQQLDTHLVRIVNMCRNGITDNEIRVTADFCGVPQWLVMRVAHDLGTLTVQQETRYQQARARIERIKTTGDCTQCGSTRDACDERLFKHPKRCCPACKEQGPIRMHEEK